MLRLILVPFLISSWSVFGASAKLVDIPSRCCTTGANWGSEGNLCNTFPTPIAGVSNLNQKICSDVLKFCCEREYILTQCKFGIIFAKRFHHCSLENTTDPNPSTHAENCCSGCLLAESLMEAQVDCMLPVIKDPTYTLMFESCCTDSDEDEDYEDYDKLPSKNLCELLPGQLCTHFCVPTAHSYICECREGFTLMEDQKTCQPNKTKVKTPLLGASDILPNPERPIPIKKVSKPFKPPDFAKKHKCKGSNPCEQECTITSGSKVCSCRPGYELLPDGIHCKDVNECLDNVHVCDPTTEICRNEVGSYHCEIRDSNNLFSQKLPARTSTSTTSTSTTTPATSTTSPTSTTTRAATSQLPRITTPIPPITCSKGFTSVENGCMDMDECDPTTHPEVCEPNETCVNTVGSYECRCEGGFHWEKTTGFCVDINECQTNTHDCLAEQRCDNTVGSFVCHRTTGCGTGYTLNANTGLCEDDDECLLQTDHCRLLGNQYICKNTLGSFRCERKRCSPGSNCTQLPFCQNGFEENSIGQCVDIDECKKNKHNCDLNTEICVNNPGGYKCHKLKLCPGGYKSTVYGCIDIDECATGGHNCGSNSLCRNHNGGFTCECLPGYRSIGFSDCGDLNECNLGACPPTADCQNLPGSYLCNCKPGFKQSAPNHCEDEDECLTTPGLCQHACLNEYGTYRCSCKNGFLLSDNNRTCDDINECLVFRDRNLCSGECVNLPGSYTCSCPNGYILGRDARTCQDIDECTGHPCRGVDEVCLNTRGSYACNSIRCPPGYMKDAHQKNRCIRLPCRDNFPECFLIPLTHSFNFITFVSMLPIPPAGYLDLFTMKGPVQPGSESQFELKLLDVTGPPNVPSAEIGYFHLRKLGVNQVVVALARPIPGPQRIDLQLTASLYHSGAFGSKAVARLIIHVSQYEY